MKSVARRFHPVAMMYSNRGRNRARVTNTTPQPARRRLDGQEGARFSSHSQERPPSPPARLTVAIWIRSRYTTTAPGPEPIISRIAGQEFSVKEWFHIAGRLVDKAEGLHSTERRAQPRIVALRIRLALWPMPLRLF